MPDPKTPAPGEFEGMWFEGRNLVRVSVDGGRMVATSRYWHGKWGDVAWRLAGVVDGNRFEGTLRHERPSGFSVQRRRGELENGVIEGEAVVGSETQPFTWRRRSATDVCSEVPGHLYDEEVVELSSNAKAVAAFGGHVLEVGGLLGKSAVATAYGLEEAEADGRVFSVDCGLPLTIGDSPGYFTGEAMERVATEWPSRVRFSLFVECCSAWMSRIVPVFGYADGVMPVVAPGATVVFIDGDHSADAVHADVTNVLETGSVRTLMLHDWDDPHWGPGVKEGAERAGLGAPVRVVRTMGVWEY